MGARRVETAEVARAYVDCRDWDEVKRRIVQDNLANLNAESTRKRFASEVAKRLRNLHDGEIAFFADAVVDDQRAMLWVAICRTYPILRSFSRDVVSARFANMVPDVPKTAWLAFVEDEKPDHPELERLTEKSLKKLEIRTFGMLRECRLIDAGFNITPLYPSERFAALLRGSAPQELEHFPWVGVFL